MSTLSDLRSDIVDHFDRRWLVWVVGIVALVVGIMIGYIIPSGGFGGAASTSLGGGAGQIELRQGGR
ncbi:hypothetical protein [Antiquaquibacter soli]|uniref:Uncharacterized protein n=1 Tax=Antiquaquibacter soli TaxID=3064523 RepID=A0ABT9BPR8_9MICO|nr:hypothetical protein [Protaetiibacter sp. WY-16]MDO7881410.1 hypothetical protein [Protaetiibacter sp. WY-16]